ncbi:hypothetical protein J1N35_006766 [Gossypium stocksii]|uniref:ZF-HD dimerization-type domain-containing protein n=1 Tax=Gossypium stocksii TaxID=47602 RepID=A0A9D3W7A5_9ROSI|nr:hypothetical protein J1N35_006766 [Gossypium stocksii]
MELRDQDKEMGLPLPLSSSQTPNPRPPQTLNHYPNIDPAPPGPVAGAEPEPVGSSLVVRYRECLKNHAATMGGHVVDGCGEFMPSGEEGTMAAMKCAACECHRNFHRKEINGESQYIPPLPRRNGVVHLQQQPVRFPAPVMMSFGGGGGGTAEESSSEDLRHDELINVPQSSKKRFRTKFSQDQKEKMMEFAETLGWRIQKQDEHELQMFCSQVGVKRQVFKVWMHNNKQAMKKKQMKNKGK